MINDLEGKKIVVEIRELVNGLDNVKNEVNLYCELVKQMFLAASGQN